MLVFVSLTFSLFWFAYRHNYYYVQRNKIDTHGLLFNNALSQLFAGVYVSEIALIGLFFLVRDAQNDLACTSQAIIMIVVLILTAIYHFVMEEHLRPLYEFIPVTLEDMAADAEKIRFSVERRAMGNQSPSTTDFAISSAIELSTLESHPSSPAQIEKSAALKPEIPPSGRARAITNASTLTAASARHALSIVKRRAQLSSASSVSLHRPHSPLKYTQQRRQAADELGAAIASYPDALTDLSQEERTAQLQAAFQDPVTREPRPIVWIPSDEAGVAEEIVRWVGEVYGGCKEKVAAVGGNQEEQKGGEAERSWLEYSCEGAQLLKGGKVQITRPPPDIRADWCLEWQL